LLKIDNDLERQFYQQQAVKDNWSVRELKRHKTSALFQRLALSKDKKSILALAKKGQHTKFEQVTSYKKSEKQAKVEVE